MGTGCVRGVKSGGTHLMFTNILRSRNYSHLQIRKPKVRKLPQNSAEWSWDSIQACWNPEPMDFPFHLPVKRGCRNSCHDSLENRQWWWEAKEFRANGQIRTILGANVSATLCWRRRQQPLVFMGKRNTGGKAVMEKSQCKAFCRWPQLNLV